MEEINEEPIIEKGLTVEIVETIKEEIIEEVVNDLDEIKLDDCNIQTPIILDRKSTRLNSSHVSQSRMPSSA